MTNIKCMTNGCNNEAVNRLICDWCHKEWMNNSKYKLKDWEFFLNWRITESIKAWK